MKSKKSDFQEGNSVHQLFCRLPLKTIHRLSRQIVRQSPSRGLTYTDEHGKTKRITLTLRPRVIDKAKRNSLWHTLKILDGAFYRIASLYGNSPELYEIFPFEPREEDWISMLRHPDYVPGRIVSRWDANTAFGKQDWKEGTQFFEVNGVGVGGLWYGPACADLMMETVVPELRKLDPSFRPSPSHDMRILLLHLLSSQRKKIGRTRGSIALTMEKASGSNYIEFERLARFFRKCGHSALVVEPTDLLLQKGEITAHGKKIDIVYRDTTLEELCHLEAKGHDLAALRKGFKRGQVVSSLEGEFDHKSVFEVLTDPRHVRFFTPQEQILFKRCLLWTRMVRETRTTDAHERSVDLIPYCLKKQESLVLKPNRLYGGQGVVFGHEAAKNIWHKKIALALKERGQWVIQQRGNLRQKRFFRPLDKKIEEENLYVVSGFFATEGGLGIVGRMSEKKIVNVARRGGLTPILLVP